MIEQYSVIVVGAGHNGLVAAIYLARAGAQVLVLERRDLVGGACVTEELFPGFRVSSCSYICHLLQQKVIDDLKLTEHGFEVCQLEPYRFSPFPDGRYILTWQDHDRTIDAIRQISPMDAQRYPEWSAFWKRAAGILHRTFLADPPTLAEVAETVRGTREESIFEQMITGNMKDLVERYFDSPIVRALFTDAHDAGDIRAPGSIMAVAYIMCGQFTDPRFVGIPKGGMGGITQAMARAAEACGVEIRTGAEIEQITVDGGKVTGVLMASGERINSDVVLSNADPKRTFLSLVDRGALASPFVDDIQRLQTNVSCLKFHCSMRALPDFSAYLGRDFDPRMVAQVRICPSVDYFEQSWEDAKNGVPSSCPIMYIQIPSVCDATLTPPGQHVMSVWSRYAPVTLRTGSWDEAKQRVGEHLIDTMAQYAPNLPDIIGDWELFTPADLERRVYLTDGNIRHLDIISSQMLAQRPHRDLSSYRTPIEGLYLCGAGTHPGGEVTGAPGHNAAAAVLRERGFDLHHSNVKKSR